MIRILIADDHAIVRAGLKQFIADQPDMQITAEAATGNETIALVRAQEFDVVLLDISMPDKNGIDTLKTLKHVRAEPCPHAVGIFRGTVRREPVTAAPPAISTRRRYPPSSSAPSAPSCTGGNS
jgi:DNA-binding NarL/FixJ family response regulator